MRLYRDAVNILFRETLLLSDVHGLTMGESGGVTRRQAGMGLMFLGAILLMLEAVFFIMSALQNDYYFLFSGKLHLAFDSILGMALIVSGLLLARHKAPEPGQKSNT
jgi:hypothetical protein